LLRDVGPADGVQADPGLDDAGEEDGRPDVGAAELLRG
jgi:hypothetical protein